jgi:hypothetical protein
VMALFHTDRANAEAMLSRADGRIGDIPGLPSAAQD